MEKKKKKKKKKKLTTISESIYEFHLDILTPRRMEGVIQQLDLPVSGTLNTLEDTII